MEYMRIEDQFPRLNNCAVTLGKFDGIHRGHRKLMDKILERKKETGVQAVVLAFVSDRKTVLTNSERRDFLEHMGADILLECPLTSDIRHMKADTFVRQVLAGSLKASYVAIGNMDLRWRSFQRRWMVPGRSAVPISERNLQKEIWKKYLPCWDLIILFPEL